MPQELENEHKNKEMLTRSASSGWRFEVTCRQYWGEANIEATHQEILQLIIVLQKR